MALANFRDDDGTHLTAAVGTVFPTDNVPFGTPLFQYVSGSTPLRGTWWVFTEAGWVAEEIPGLGPVYVHTIAISVVNAAAAQTDVITIDGVACSFTSDATPTTAEISTGLRAAIAASAAAGKFTVSGTTNVVLTPATAANPVVSVSANLTDVQTIGAPVMGSVSVSAIAAGEAHIGEVGSNTILVAITPTIDAAAYIANDNICAIQTIANAVRVAGGTGILQSIVVQDLAAQNAVLQIFLFSANPGTGTYTKNAECDLDDTDAGLCIGMIEIAAADYKTVKDNSIATVKAIGLPIKCAATSLFAVIKTTGTPTYAGTSDLKFTFGILRD